MAGKKDKTTIKRDTSDKPTPTKRYNYETKPNGKNDTGAPSKFKPEYCRELVDWMDKEPYKTEDGKRIPNDLPTFEKFSHHLNVTIQTLLNWCDEYPEFLESYKRAKQLQLDFWRTNSLLGLYPPGFACFAGKNMFEWRDKLEHDIGNKDGLPFEVNINFVSPKKDQS